MESSKDSPITSLRVLRLGDSWSYGVTGVLVPPGGEAQQVSGQINVSIVPDRLGGRAEWKTILFSQQFQISQPDGSKVPMPAPEWMFSFVQDPDSRDLSISADNMTRDGSARIAKVPQVFYPGTWSAETSYSNRLEFDSGDFVDNTLTVFGEETVEAGPGSFPSWKSRITSVSAATGLIEGMDWWTPELGAPAKFSTISKMPDGAEFRFTATLTGSSVL